jgi:single-stranded DNA-binding protein
VGKYFKKGDPCAITGTVQNRSYEVDGQKRYITEIITDSVEFVPKTSGEPKEQPKKTIDDLEEIEDDSSLPF